MVVPPDVVYIYCKYQRHTTLQERRLHRSPGDESGVADVLQKRDTGDSEYAPVAGP